MSAHIGADIRINSNKLVQPFAVVKMVGTNIEWGPGTAPGVDNVMVMIVANEVSSMVREG